MGQPAFCDVRLPRRLLARRLYWCQSAFATLYRFYSVSAVFIAPRASVDTLPTSLLRPPDRSAAARSIGSREATTYASTTSSCRERQGAVLCRASPFVSETLNHSDGEADQRQLQRLEHTSELDDALNSYPSPPNCWFLHFDVKYSHRDAAVPLQAPAPSVSTSPAPPSDHYYSSFL